MRMKHLQKKRALRSVLFVLLLGAVGMTKGYAAFDFSADCESGQTLYYNIVDPSNYYVELTCPGSESINDCWAGFTRPEGEIILPANVQYDGATYTVISIGNYAFRSCGELTGSLTIPNTVTVIGDQAFGYCKGLTGSLTIPGSVTTIGNYAFYFCGFTGELIIPNSVITIGDYAFQYCRSLTGSLIIPNSVTSIGQYAFRQCNGFTGDLMIPNSLTTIGYQPFPTRFEHIVVSSGNSAFDSRNGCNAFIDSNTNQLICGCKNTIIPNSVTSIGNSAFEDCIGLTSVTIPSSMNYISSGAFNNCSGIEQLVVESGNTVYDSRNGCNAIIETNSNVLVLGCKNTIIPNSVEEIDSFAFYGCTGLTSIVIPNSVVWIWNQAFACCTGLTSIEIPSSVVYLLNYPFYMCDFEQIVVNPANPYYDSRNNCNAIIRTSSNELVLGCKNTVIPNTVTSIGSSAFHGCKSMPSIEIPNSVTRIGLNAFNSCFGLTSLVLPSSITNIDGCAFQNCTGLTSITSLAETPPTMGFVPFDQVDKSIPVYVPCGALEAYQNNAGWNVFTNIVEMCSSEITATANPSEGGTVSGMGTYDFGTTVALTATANDGYIFTCWTENGEIVSTEATYTFTVMGDRALVANFFDSSNHWMPNEDDYEDNMTFTCVVQLDGVEQRTTLLELGAFCGEECRGAQLATYFAPTDRYIYQMMVFGEGNDEITFRLYDHVMGQELILTSPSPVTFSTNGYGSLTAPYVLNFTSTVIHTQALHSGWNWWSTYVELNDNDGLSQLENSIGSAGVMIKSRNTGYVETYEYNGETNWYGTLSSITNEQMYKIRTNAACEATVEGLLTVPADHPVTIKSGWNWIGFPCNQDVSVDVAMSNFSPENNDVIKGRNGYTTYYSDGSYNMWYGTLNTFEVGKGYMYRSNSATQKTLVFQTGRGETASENVMVGDNIFQPSDEAFADNMTLTAVVELDGEEVRSEAYEVAAFVGNECRGSVKLMYVEPVNRYVAFLTVFGEPSETLCFRLANGEQTELSMDEVVFVADDMSGTLSEPMTLHFGVTEVGESQLPKVSVYPNPSKGVFNIQGQDIRKVEVFNAYGQAVVSVESGDDHVQIDLSRYADGCYMLRVVTGNGITNSQLIKR